jgi:hypothetical protein
LTITKINAILSYKVKGEDKMIRAEIKKELPGRIPGIPGYSFET